MNPLSFKSLQIKNWKNFTSVDCGLASRVFLVGPNASGKSNFLDVFRFLHDIAIEGGGLAKAVELRGDMPRVRSLYARGMNTEIAISVKLGTPSGVGWKYELAFKHRSIKDKTPIIVKEEVLRIY